MVLLDSFVAIKSGVPQCKLRSVQLLRGCCVHKWSLQRGLGMISGLNYTTEQTGHGELHRASSAVIKL